MRPFLRTFDKEGMTPEDFYSFQGLSLVQIVRILQRAENRKQIVKYDLVNQKKIPEQECLDL